MIATASLLLTTQAARADFEINIFSGTTLIFESIDNVAEDDNSVGHQIGLSGASLQDLNAALAGAGLTIQFDNLSATTNLGSSDPFANLTVNGQARGIGSVVIDVEDTDYGTPAGNSKVVSSSASMTFTNAAGSTGSFTSYYNGDDSQFGRVTPTDPLTFAAVPGQIVSGGQGTASPLSVSGPDPFALENATRLTLVGDASTKVGFSGTTTLTAAAVPEPSSLALCGLGLASLVGYARRRKGATA